MKFMFTVLDDLEKGSHFRFYIMNEFTNEIANKTEQISNAHDYVFITNTPSYVMLRMDWSHENCFKTY